MLQRVFSRQLIAVLTAAAFLSGCGSTTIQIPTLATFDGYNRDVDAHRIHATLGKEHYDQPMPIDLACFSAIIPDAGVGIIQDLRERQDWSRKECGFPDTFRLVGNDPRERRNFIQNELMRRSDQICSYYMTRMLYGQFIGNAGANAAKAFGAALKTVTKSVDDLSEALLIGASPGLTNIDVLKWKTFSDTAIKIKRSRAKLGNLIRSVQREPISNYSVSQAIYDTERYHGICNIATIIADTPLGDADIEEVLVPVANTPPKPNAPPEKAKAKSKSKPK